MNELRRKNEGLEETNTPYPATNTAYPANSETWTSSAVAIEEESYQPGKDVAGKDIDVAPGKKSYTDADYANSDFAGPLFADAELKSFREQWDQVQASFVDEPREAVRNADSLVANVVQRIEEQFAQERNKLEKQWENGSNISTEEMRQALKKYRALFGRLLAF
ncbi:hypothetical protein ACFPT7_10860 [Acidicapsa dinghuensis]|uniref:Uncharacterized protein n=1 Tax=Acidicapsa dinghuensis TaxID=2218256 RepID=A0ABW1EEN1_9BACT|nr:hypothetical protein [Acidicapsa dinghuensis]